MTQSLADKLRDGIRLWLEATPPKIDVEKVAMTPPPSPPIIIIFSNGDRIEVEAEIYFVHDDHISFFGKESKYTHVEIARINRADIDFISIGDIIHECVASCGAGE